MPECPGPRRNPLRREGTAVEQEEEIVVDETQLIRSVAKAKLASPEASNRSLAAIAGVTHPSMRKLLAERKGGAGG